MEANIEEQPEVGKENPDIEWPDGYLADDETDGFVVRNSWAFMCEDLSALMRKLNKGDEWRAVSRNFGWRSLNSLVKDFRAKYGNDLLGAILPNCDCHFRIWLDRKNKQLHIQNFHHDSPTGNEFYLVWSAKRKRREPTC